MLPSTGSPTGRRERVVTKRAVLGSLYCAFGVASIGAGIVAHTALLVVGVAFVCGGAWLLRPWFGAVDPFD